jgi:glutamate dehydrogenase
MNMEQNTLDAFLNARKQIKQACDLYGECSDDANKYELISHPKRILEVNIPVRMDDGTVKTFTGFRSQHNDAR